MLLELLDNYLGRWIWEDVKPPIARLTCRVLAGRHLNVNCEQACALNHNIVVERVLEM